MKRKQNALKGPFEQSRTKVGVAEGKTAVQLLGQGTSKCLGAERRRVSQSNKGESLE